MMWARYAALITLLLVAGTLACALILSDDPVPADTVSFADTTAVTTYWTEQVRTDGGRVAYQAFSRWLAPASINEQHTLAHVMGGALYDIEGVAGLSVCDSSFSFGCFHEFLGRAIHHQGLGVVQELNEACVRKLGAQALSCQHGIGHGVQTFLGYDDEALLGALAECRVLPYSDPIGGCYGGVFMEYNMRTMLSLDGVGVRTHEDPHHPCSLLAPEYLPACYYWQPQWWIANRDGDMRDAYRTAGERCRAAGTPALVKKCFEGVGNISGQAADYEPARTIALCTAAAAGRSDQELFCRADAANTYFTIPSAQEDALAVCAGLTDGAYEYCRAYSENVFNQVNQPPAEQGDGTHP